MAYPLPGIHIPPGVPTFAPDPLNVHFRIPRVEGIDHDNLPVSEQIEQMDQRITLTLQGIDADLSKIQNVILTRILPQVKRYSAATLPAREAARYWKTFFEAAAQARVPQPGDETLYTESAVDTTAASARESDADADATISHGTPSSGHQSFLASLALAGGSSTPLGAAPADDSSASWKVPVQGSFAKLSNQVRTLEVDESILPYFSLPSASDAGDYIIADADETVRLDSGAVSRQEEEEEEATMEGARASPSMAHSLARLSLGAAKSRGGGATFDPLPPPPQASARQRTPRAGKGKTPAAGQKTPRNPFGGKGWNGIADLRTTPLRTGIRGAGGLDDDDDDDDEYWPPGMSPPVTMKFTMPKSTSTLTRTPAKEAVSSIMQNILREVGDVGDTPSHGSGSMPTPPSFLRRNYGPPISSASHSHLLGSSQRAYSSDSESDSSDDSLVYAGAGGGGEGKATTPYVAEINALLDLDEDSDEGGGGEGAATAVGETSPTPSSSIPHWPSLDPSRSDALSDADLAPDSSSDTLFGPRPGSGPGRGLQLHGEVTRTYHGTQLEHASGYPDSPLG